MTFREINMFFPRREICDSFTRRLTGGVTCAMNCDIYLAKCSLIDVVVVLCIYFHTSIIHLQRQRLVARHKLPLMLIRKSAESGHN